MLTARKLNLSFALAGMMVALGCATVPVTQRKQLTLVPDSQLVRMSLQSYREVLAESKLSTDTEQVQAVRRVGQRLARATEEYLRANGLPTSQYAWEFNVIQDDKTVNAWAMPGGKMAVYTGILPITKDDNGLAVVMSHEIAHAVARHGNERMSQGLLVDLGGVALSEALHEQPEGTRGLFLASYGVGTQLGALLPYSRLHESEADRIGLTLMARAGYDPRQAVPFWQRMNAVGGPRPPEFLSTHPAPASRIANIEEYLPEALAIYQAR